MIIYTLYVKTHNKTGLKYLGQTSSTNPHQYPGSGTYWRYHLNSHGYQYTTDVIKECHTKEELKNWGLYYSNLWNVVDSKEWANLKEESGSGGDPGPEGRKKISKTLTGRTLSKETREKLSVVRKGKKQKRCSDIGKANITAGNRGKNLGRVLSEETKAKIKASNKATWERKQLLNKRVSSQ